MPGTLLSMNTDRYRGILSKFHDARVLAVGDLYLDEDLLGQLTGVSLEAPVPIFEVAARRYNPGAAGNVACNAAALGAKTYAVGVVGNDPNADILRAEFTARGVDHSGLVVDAARPTNTYGKLKAGGHDIPAQELLRTDTPLPPRISGDVEAQVVRAIEDRAAAVDVILVTDQVSAVVTDAVLETIHTCREKYGFLLLGDSREGIGRFTGFDVLTPNASEAGRDTGLAQVDDAGRELAELSGATFVTRGPQGISVYSQNEDPIWEAARAPKVVDVTGAGDTVSAAVALALFAGASNREAAVIANAAAGITVGRAGAVTVTADEVEEALISDGTPLKVKSLPELKSIVARFQSEGKRVVWTNGCFDILHVGHISYLVRAAREGDILVVGLNSDASVSRVKGPDRPIVPEAERALILSSLEFVDFVTVFSDESPAAILEHLEPDVYSKGGDYTIDTINQTERKIVEGYGGRISIVPGAEGKSTTNLVERIIKENDH